MAANWGASATAGGEVLQTKKVAGGAGAAGWGLSRTAGGEAPQTKKVTGGVGAAGWGASKTAGGEVLQAKKVSYKSCTTRIRSRTTRTIGLHETGHPRWRARSRSFAHRATVRRPPSAPPGAID